MNIWEILVIALAVSLDALAVSISGAICRPSAEWKQNAFRAALFFGGFQFIMPVIGYFTASLLGNIVANCDHWLAFILLFLVGGKMVCESFSKDDDETKTCPVYNFFEWKRLFIPAIATSLDALAVGAGMKFANSPLWIPAIAMGVVTAIIAALGVGFAIALSKLAGEKKLTLIGGLAIILIGTKILITDLFFTK